MAGAILFLISAVFVFAGVSKLRARSEFEKVLARVLPASVVTPTAFAVPLFELGLAILLLNAPTQKIAIMATIATLVVFTFVLFELQRRGVKGCACFGESSS